MHDICNTREMCEARKSRSSRACRASSRDPCMRDVWGMPRPADLRACEASDPWGHYNYIESKEVFEHSILKANKDGSLSANVRDFSNILRVLQDDTE